MRSYQRRYILSSLGLTDGAGVWAPPLLPLDAVCRRPRLDEHQEVVVVAVSAGVDGGKGQQGQQGRQGQEVHLCDLVLWCRFDFFVMIGVRWWLREFLTPPAAITMRWIHNLVISVASHCRLDQDWIQDGPVDFRWLHNEWDFFYFQVHVYFWEIFKA